MISIPFQQWFTAGNVVGGDWRFFWPDNLREILSYSFAWDSSLNTGLGRSNLPILWLNSYLAYGAHFLTQLLHIPWGVAEKLLFFWPIFFLSFFSAFFLSKRYSSTHWSILAGIIYLTNTYALMIFSGGQVGVGLAYSVIPFVLLSFMKVIDSVVFFPQNSKFHPFGKSSTPRSLRLEELRTNFKFAIMAGLILALQVLFDPRIAVLSLLMVTIYFLFYSKQLLRGAIFVFIIPSVVVFLLHAFWILPILISKINPVSSQFNSLTLSSGLVRFFSFANFESTLSLLHPNWPENIFGKIYFMRPEFLVLPILAFSSFLFIKKNKQKGRSILFFSLLALLGAFLAKGANPPLGDIYLWLIDHVALFAIFRDPTKFYILVAVAYSVLIPMGLESISEQIRTHWKVLSSRYQVSSIFFVLFIFYFIFLLRPAFLGEVKGTFAQHSVPNEYVQLKDFLSKEPQFFRTLWVPKWQRFGFFSNNHPAVSAEELLGISDAKSIMVVLQKEKMVVLQEAGVKYVIVPYDAESEIFLIDRKYDEKQYVKLVKDMEGNTFLRKVDGFEKIIVFQVPTPKDHFFIDGTESQTQLTYQRINPTEYIVNIQGGRKGELLVFSERYDRNWVAKVKNSQISSSRFHGLFNSFILSENGDSSLEISYTPQRFVVIGSFVSIFSLFLFGLVILKKKMI